MPLRCSVCEGPLTVHPRSLCHDHKTERAKELARLRARHYRALKQGDPMRDLSDPDAAPITLTPSKIRRLATLTIDPLDEENAMRAWAANPSNQPIPPAVGEHFAAAGHLRKALSGLIKLNRE